MVRGQAACERGHEIGTQLRLRVLPQRCRRHRVGLIRVVRRQPDQRRSLLAFLRCKQQSIRVSKQSTERVRLSGCMRKKGLQNASVRNDGLLPTLGGVRNDSHDP
jgi:hypothetical protein